MVEVFRISGEDIHPYLPAAARLRIRVFKEYPYLYDGSEAYEQEYLSSYSGSRSCVFVVAARAGQVVGVSTGLPLAEADDAFQAPFRSAGWDLSRIFYFGESVLAPDERGQGIGHRFFDEREMHAAELGYPVTAFCSVERPDHHPMKPLGYRSNDQFWIKRGYQKQPELFSDLEWKQVDQEDAETCNRLTFWVKGALEQV